MSTTTLGFNKTFTVYYELKRKLKTWRNLKDKSTFIHSWLNFLVKYNTNSHTFMRSKYV